MASMLENVLGYLRPKSQTQTEETADENFPPPAKTCPDCGTETDEDADWVYDIEEQDEWQIVRKMDEDEVDYLDGKDENDEDAEQAELEDEVSGMEDADHWSRRAGSATAPCLRLQKSWYLAPPPCFTRSAPSPSTNPLENLLIEHPSMSVYLLPVAASTARQAQLCRSAPAAIMERTLAGQLPMVVPDVDVGLQENSPQKSNDEQTAVVPSKPMSNKRKRRIRQQQQLERTANNHPPNSVTAAPQQRMELGVVRTAGEIDKIAQNEDRQRRLAKNVLAKAQLKSDRFWRLFRAESLMSYSTKRCCCIGKKTSWLRFAWRPLYLPNWLWNQHALCSI